VEFAKSQVEWMSDKIMKMFEVDRYNPFQFKYVSLCHSLAELAKIPEPKVVLASSADLQFGFAKDLFTEWCSNPKNSLVLTNRTSIGTLTRMLIDNPNKKSLEVEVKRRVRLEGEELERFLEKEKEKEKEKKQDASLKGHSRVVFEDSDSDSDDEMGGGMSRHDLMMTDDKGGRKSSFFKQAKTYPMFPCHEERVKWDDYGEIIRPEEFMIHELLAAEEEKGKVDQKKDSHVMEVDHSFPGEADTGKVPTKCVTEKRSLDIKCSVLYIDFEGRSDGESIKRILSLVNPRQLILVHGSEESVQHLAEYCRVTPTINVGKVYTPVQGEHVDATSETHIYQVKLRDALVSSLQFSKARDAELAWVDGQLSMRQEKSRLGTLEEGEVEDDEDMETNQEKEEPMDSVPVLEQLPLLEIPGHTAVFINEPRLSDFKQILTKSGIQAEFAGGVLVCNNVVAVKRNEAGRIILEGAVCDDYYKVREMLYEQYAVV